MFLENYPCTTSRFCHSRVLKGLSSAPAVLLVHGFMASPYDLSWIGRQLNESGYSVYIPRLPGHGTNGNDFLASTQKDWIRRVFDCYIDLISMHEQVFVAGHSMGGLLASLVAARFNPEKLILFAPAFCVDDKRIPLTLFLQFFVKKIKSEKKSFYKDPELLKECSDYIDFSYIPKIADFYKLQKLSIKNLSYIKAETLVILSKKDKQISLTKVKELLDKKLKAVKSYLVLENSSHHLTDDIERENVAKKVIEFLKL